jgi:hypothetical protein
MNEATSYTIVAGVDGSEAAQNGSAGRWTTRASGTAESSRYMRGCRR